MSRMYYRPNEFADLAGVSVKTLHRWDSSGKLKPSRTIGGHRYYTDEHINQKVGIDLGIKTFATLSDPNTFDTPSSMKRAKIKLG